MTSSDSRTAALIAVGASVASNCRPCLKAAVVKAGLEGVEDKDIAEAIEIGMLVRHCAASNMDGFAASISRSSKASSFEAAADGACRCATLKNKKRN